MMGECGDPGVDVALRRKMQAIAKVGAGGTAPASQ